MRRKAYGFDFVKQMLFSISWTSVKAILSHPPGCTTVSCNWAAPVAE